MAVPWAAAVLLGLTFLLASAGWADASLPAVTCDGNSRCTVVTAYREWADRKPCEVGQVVYPKTEADLVAAVAQAVKSGTKMKVVSKSAHSFPKLACPAGDSGLLISTRDFNTLISVDKRALTVTVDAGVQVTDLLRALADQGLAFPMTPYWGELSVSGMIATGAHGSSFWGKGSAAHEYVASVRVVLPASAHEGYAKVRTFSAADPKELAALKVHLGLLGAVSQVTLKVQHNFKRSITFDVTGDGELESRLLQVAREQEFGDVVWYPAQHQVRYRYDNRVPVNATGDGSLESFPPIREPDVEAFRAADLATEATRDAAGQCARSAAVLRTVVSSGFGLSSNRSNPFVFQGYPVVGFTDGVQTSAGCTAGPKDVQNPTNPDNQMCLWDLGRKGAFVYNTGVAIPVSKMKHFIQDVRQLVKLRPFGLCDVEIYGGLVMRFVKGNSGAYLGKAQDVVDVELTFKRANDARTPIVNSDVHAELEQMALFKYEGTPHWGKGRPIAFTGAAAKYPRFNDFLKVKRQLDPNGYFSNEWTDAVLGVRGSVSQEKPYCALEGLCICSKDVHCNPKAGYFCRPGLVYKDARVCRFDSVRGHKGRQWTVKY